MNYTECLLAGLPDDIRNLVERGGFKLARRRIASLLNSEIPSLLRARLVYELERIKRIEYMYPYSRDEAFNLLLKEVPDLSLEDFDRWVKEGYIDSRVIEGEEKYFRSFILNLYRFCKEASERRVTKPDPKIQEARKYLLEQIDRIIEEAKKTGSSKVLPHSFRLKLTVEVKEDAVPEGEVIRCWLPIPKPTELQTNIKIISTSPEYKYIAPEDAPQRTIYFETVADGKPKTFSVEFEYTIKGFYLEVNPEKVKEYDENSPVYVKYTREEPPHIVFTPYIRRLVEKITNGEKNPYLRAWKIYKWITTNVRYATAYDYAIYENISDYVARNLKGDCGMQALLFITMARAAGIPARWESGWYMNPKSYGMHDWARFYIEPFGWLWADLSFGGARRQMPKYHSFYFGNIDNFRLVFNSEISTQFQPPKKHWRSDPVDNQRGEIEWNGGNLYYDKWTYKMELIEYKQF